MKSRLPQARQIIDEKVKLWEHNLTEVQKDIAEQKKLISEPFAKQAELDQKRARYNEVMEILNPKEEQSLDSVADDTVQEQSRAYLKDDYSTEGVHWGIEEGIITNKEARIIWESIAKIEKSGYNSYPKTMYGDSFIESDNFLMVVDTDYHNPLVKTIYKFNDTYETNMAIAKERLINAKGNTAGNREALQIIDTLFGKGYVEQYDFEDSRTYGGQDGRREGANSRTQNSGTPIREWRFDEQ